MVTVTGAGSAWEILSQVGGGAGILEIGRYGLSEGTLNVLDQGKVVVYGQTTVGLNGGTGTILISGGTLSTGPVLADLGALVVGPTGTLAAGPLGPQPSVLQLGGGTSTISGKLDLRGANGTPGALQVEFLKPNGQPAEPGAGLAVSGQVLLAFATTNSGSLLGPAANGSSSATLGTGTGNSLLTLTETGTLDLTGATFHLIGGSGLSANWDRNQYYSWLVIQTGPGVTVTGLDAATIDASQFGQPLGGGAFTLTSDADGVYVAFSPVPEPATVLGIAAGVLALGAGVRRLRHREWASV